MPIKKTTDPCTGIYRRWHMESTSHSDGTPDHGAMRDVLMAAGDAATNLYNHRLEDVEKYCDEILSADDPTSHIPRQNKDIKMDKRRRKEFVNDVKAAKTECSLVRNLLSPKTTASGRGFRR